MTASVWRLEAAYPVYVYSPILIDCYTCLIFQINNYASLGELYHYLIYIIIFSLE